MIRKIILKWLDLSSTKVCILSIADRLYHTAHQIHCLEKRIERLESILSIKEDS